MRIFSLFVAFILAAAAQEPEPIRVNVRLINVSFSVRDAKGNLVRDLSKDDFEVLDDGVPQTVAFFAKSADVPLSLSVIADFSGSQSHFVKQHEKDINTFLKETLTARDRASAVGFTGRVRVISDFSSSSKELMERIHDGSPKHKEWQDLPELGPREIRSGGTSFYDALFYTASRMLAKTDSGRRALLIFSDGEDTSSAHHLLDVIEAAQKENVTIFGIRYTEMNHEGLLTARNKYGTSVMARISLETGGVDYDSEKVDLRESFREIGEQLRSSYELAYHASQPLKDGTFHKVVIRAKRPGLTVRAKSGYYARETEIADPEAAASEAAPVIRSKKRKK